MNLNGGFMMPVLITCCRFVGRQSEQLPIKTSEVRIMKMLAYFGKNSDDIKKNTNLTI
jgi:hypothetical protein